MTGLTPKGKLLHMPDDVERSCASAFRRLLKREIQDLEAKLDSITEYIAGRLPR